MMNSTNNNDSDDFGANPFRTSDVFYDASDAQQQQQQQSFQPNTPQMQQLQPQDPFQPQAAAAPSPIMTMNQSFPPPSGPMDGGMNMGQQQPFQQQQQPAGLMSPQPQMRSPPQQLQQPPHQPTSWWGSILLCLNLDTYKIYFDIDADDTVTRIRAVFLHFYKPEHFRNNVVGPLKTGDLKGPDLYGPFWISMTMIFILGVTANFHAYVHHVTSSPKGGAAGGGGGNSTSSASATETVVEEEFEYDINHLLNAAYICCGFAFVLPAILWITTQCCMSMKALTLAEWICLYGYSLVPYLPVAVLCIIPFGIVSWVLLAAATAVSVLLVVRNVAHALLSNDVGQAKAPPIILIILGTHVIFFLFLKFSFFHPSG